MYKWKGFPETGCLLQCLEVAWFILQNLLRIVYYLLTRSSYISSSIVSHVNFFENIRWFYEVLLQECLKKCIELVKAGVPVLFFPEGTRTSDGKMAAFKVHTIPLCPMLWSRLVQNLSFIGHDSAEASPGSDMRVCACWKANKLNVEASFPDSIPNLFFNDNRLL